MKATSTLFLILLFKAMAGQTNEQQGTLLFEQGVAAYENSQIREADSLFLLSAAAYPNDNVFYNLSITKLKLGDTCQSCSYLFEASKFGSEKYYKMYKTRCVTKQRVWYINDTDSTQFYSIIYKNRCTDDFDIHFYKFYSNGKPDREVWLSKFSNDYLVAYQTQSFPIEQYVDTSIFTIFEEAPSFPGGDDGLMTFLMSNLSYPQLAKDHDIQGTVILSFVVSSSGKIGNISVLKGIGGGCDEEAVRVVSIMPDWIPGKQNGKPVNILFTFPIRFVLQY